MKAGQCLRWIQTAVGFAIMLLKFKWNSHWVRRWIGPLSRSGRDSE
jgi:hypothetical protein